MAVPMTDFGHRFDRGAKVVWTQGLPFFLHCECWFEQRDIDIIDFNNNKLV